VSADTTLVATGFTSSPAQTLSKLPDISKLSGTLIDNVGKVDGVLKGDIASIVGLTVPSAAAFLLDTYTGAAAGYSVRRIASGATNLMRVRRTVAPFDEQDIGFDSNGELDTAAIATFGGSDPLTVSAWYDQSGQSNHATQATAGSQPTIYDGSAVITENGKPAIQGGRLNFSGVTITSAGFQVFNLFTHSGQSLWVGNAFSNQFSIQYSNSGALAYQGSFTGIQPINGTFTVGQQNLISVGDDGSKTVASINGTAAADSTGYPSANLPANLIRLVNASFGGDMNSNYRGQEVLIWNSDQFVNRSGIENNINTYFSIY